MGSYRAENGYVKARPTGPALCDPLLRPGWTQRWSPASMAVVNDHLLDEGKSLSVYYLAAHVLGTGVKGIKKYSQGTL